MNLRAIAIVFFTVCSALLAEPAKEKASLPAGPLLSRAPDFSRWVITTKQLVPVEGKQNEGDSVAKKKETISIKVHEITKTRNIYYEKLTFDGQTTQEIWTVGGNSVMYLGGSKVPVLVASQRSPSLSNPDFQELPWISPSTFISEQSTGGSKVLLFGTKKRLTQIYDNGKQGEERFQEFRALIDFESRLPIECQEGSAISSYNFMAPPSSMLVVPPAVQEVMVKWQRRNEIISTVPSRP